MDEESETELRNKYGEIDQKISCAVQVIKKELHKSMNIAYKIGIKSKGKPIEFTKRNESGLHCRFCGVRLNEAAIDLYETKPVKGIVCSVCKEKLESYL